MRVNKGVRTKRKREMYVRGGGEIRIRKAAERGKKPRRSGDDRRGTPPRTISVLPSRKQSC